MKKGFLASIVMVVVMSILLVGCGGSDDASGDSNGSDSSDDKPITIKFVHAVAADSSKGKAADYFKELVEDRLDGKVKVEVYPNGSLFDVADGLEALQAGNIQMMAPATSKLVGFDEAYQLYDLPFMFKDNDEFLRFANESEYGEELRKKVESYNLKILSTWIGGFKQFTNSKHKVTKPEDFSDLKMRVMSGGLLEDQFKTLGAGATVIPFSELYVALQQGTVDGQENSFLDIYTMKFQEVQKHLTISNHAPATFQVITNKEFWDGIPDDIRTELEDIIKEVTAEEVKITEELDQDAHEKLKESGQIEITDLTDDQRQSFKDALQPLYGEYAKKIGEDLVDAALNFD